MVQTQFWNCRLSILFRSSTEDFPENPSRPITIRTSAYRGAKQYFPFPPRVQVIPTDYGFWAIRKVYRYTVPDRNFRKCPRCPGMSENSDTRYRVVPIKSAINPLHRDRKGDYLFIESSETYPKGGGEMIKGFQDLLVGSNEKHVDSFLDTFAVQFQF